MKKVLSMLMLVSIFSLVACGSAEEGKVAEPAVAIEEVVEEEKVATEPETDAIVEETTEEHTHAEGEEHVHAEGEEHAH